MTNRDEVDITDLNVLYDAFKASIKGSSWKSEVQKFERNFLYELCKLQDELKNKTYKTGEGSRFILNERGKTRCIHGNMIRDRIVRHALCDNVIHPAIEPYLIYNNGASQTGKGTSFAREMFEKDLHNFYLKHGSNDGYIALIDFSKFFDNILHNEALNMLYPKIDEDLHWLLKEVFNNFKVDVSFMDDDTYLNCLNTKFNSIDYYLDIPDDQKTGNKFMYKSVDIGDQVSQDIGIFYPTRIDTYATVVKHCKYYGRYMDDIYIIHEDKEYLKEVVDGIRMEASKLGIFINDNKTKIVRLDSNFKYLQFKYRLSNSGKVIKKISQKTITRERRKLKAYKRLLDKDLLPYIDIENCYKSWMGTFAKYLSSKQIKNMKSLYLKLFGKNVNWKK